MRKTDELPLPTTTRPVLSPRRTDVARCPFCHADVTRGSGRVLACEQCRAYHHPGCWHEGEGCSGCGARAVFAGERPLPEPTSAASKGLEPADGSLWSRITRRPVLLGVGLALILFIAFSSWVLFQPAYIVCHLHPVIVCHTDPGLLITPNPPRTDSRLTADFKRLDAELLRIANEWEQLDWRQLDSQRVQAAAPLIRRALENHEERRRVAARAHQPAPRELSPALLAMRSELLARMGWTCGALPSNFEARRHELDLILPDPTGDSREIGVCGTVEAQPR